MNDKFTANAQNMRTTHKNFDLCGFFTSPGFQQVFNVTAKVPKYDHECEAADERPKNSAKSCRRLVRYCDLTRLILGEILMKIPMSIIISIDSVTNLAFQRFCKSLEIQLTPYDVLAIYLLIMVKSCPNDVYIQSLPRKFDCPITWNLDDLRVNCV